MKNTLIILCLVISFTSCNSDTLSTKEAETILTSQLPTFCRPQHITHDFNNYGGQINKQGLAPILDSLKKQELIRIETVRGTRNNGYHKIKLTQKAEDLGYGGKGFAIAESNLVEIIGISQVEKTATVRVKMKRMKTPLYQLHEHFWRNKPKRLECKPLEYEKDIEFILFDDGWKMK